jgi:hypothetical protein
MGAVRLVCRAAAVLDSVRHAARRSEP